MKNNPEQDIIIRHYKPGDEEKIVKFLNICYGRWGNLKKWQYLYSSYPKFSNDNIVIIEHNGEIIGHGGIHFRELVIKGDRRFLVAIMSDGATHPSYRGKGLHTKILDYRLKLAKSRGACLSIYWVMKDSPSYRNGIRLGFREICSYNMLIKILNPKKFIIFGLIDILNKNTKLRKVLQELDFDVQLYVQEQQISIKDFLNDPHEKRGYIKILLDKSAVHTIANFRGIGKFKKMLFLLHLMLFGKIKIKFNSIKTLLKFIFKIKNIIKAL
ncbi:MAG: GNAT family N-acetyltransferase [Promethearchaeota archaeon]